MDHDTAVVVYYLFFKLVLKTARERRCETPLFLRLKGYRFPDISTYWGGGVKSALNRKSEQNNYMSEKYNKKLSFMLCI